MDFVRNLSPRLSFIIYGAAAITMALFWLVIPEYSISFGWGSSRWLNGWQVVELLAHLNNLFVAFLMIGNFILPGLALLFTWKKKQLDWLWTSISFGYFFTTGIIFVCMHGCGLSFFWFFMFMIGAAWSAFAFLRRGLPASL